MQSPKLNANVSSLPGTSAGELVAVRVLALLLALRLTLCMPLLLSPLLLLPLLLLPLVLLPLPPPPPPELLLTLLLVLPSLHRLPIKLRSVLLLLGEGSPPIH